MLYVFNSTNNNPTLKTNFLDFFFNASRKTNKMVSNKKINDKNGEKTLYEVVQSIIKIDNPQPNITTTLISFNKRRAIAKDRFL